MRLLSTFLPLAAAAAAAAAAALAARAVDITISRTKTVAISETLYGYMWEDINHSGDGGLYAELLQNRAFQAVMPGNVSALYGWNATVGTTLSVVNDTAGVSKALPNSLRVDVTKGASGAVGFNNSGYWGIKVQKSWTYTASFYAKSSAYKGPVTVSLKSPSGAILASKTLGALSPSWKKHTFTLKPRADGSADAQNAFVVELDGKQAAGKAVHFGLFSLFPPTFKNRPNGMRLDLAEAMAGTRPRVWRFPGGNNLEGQVISDRWKWNETIGPLEDRPGRMGNWGYPNTDGLGLLEYLNWAEDLNATVILGVWAGISIGDYANLPGWPVVPQNALQPYIDDAIAEIEFIVGDPVKTQYGRLRASLGRRQPYALKYVEVGNEDNFQTESYAAYRWAMFVEQIGKRYPQLEFIATTLPSQALTPKYKKIDFHQYNSPDWFTNATFMFDEYPRNGTQYFVGEYAVTSTNNSNNLGTPETGRLLYPTLQGAAAEAAFMTGNERNSDVVFASAYAPTLQHINGSQWTPDMITFDAATLVKSASYHVQQMFGGNVGTHVLRTAPAQGPNSTAPLFWVASHDARTNAVIVKASNAGPRPASASFKVDGFKVGSRVGVTRLGPPKGGAWNVSNTLEHPNVVVPKTATVVAKSGGFSYAFEPYEVAVFTLTPTTKL